MSDTNPLYLEFLSLRQQIETAIAAKGPIKRLKKVLIRLEETSHTDWKAEWMETYIRLNCYLRRKPTKTFRTLKDLRALRATQDQSAAFDSFFDGVKDLLHPDRITFHGYIKTFETLDADSISAAIGDVLRPLDALGHPVFLMAGALLGLTRDGRLIGHDDDFDVGLYLGECDMPTAADRWHGVRKTLLAQGLIEDRIIENNPPVFKLQSPLGIDIDLFPAWSTNGRFSLYPFSLEDVADADIFPLAEYAPQGDNIFGDYKMLLPANPPALLAQSYGPGWVTPDPLFRFDWKPTMRRFGPLVNKDYS